MTKCRHSTYEPRHDKTNKMSVRPVKTQISLGIRPVWSESSLSAWRKLGSLATHWAHSEDSDQTGRMPRLIWVFAGRTATLLVFVMSRLIYVCFASQNSSKVNQLYKGNVNLRMKLHVQFEKEIMSSKNVGSNVLLLNQTESAHEIMALFVLRKLILQMHMRSHPVGSDFWSDPSSTSIFHVREQRRLWRDCADAHARLSLRWSHMWLVP